MNRRVMMVIGMVALATSACASTYAATPRGVNDWVVLGQRTVTDRLDHDRIPVTARRGDFKRLRLHVDRAPVDFHRVVIHYGNGDRQAIRLRTTVRAGATSPVLDLPGGDRVIRSIEFWYDANTMRGREAVVRVFALR